MSATWSSGFGPVGASGLLACFEFLVSGQSGPVRISELPELARANIEKPVDLVPRSFWGNDEHHLTGRGGSEVTIPTP